MTLECDSCFRTTSLDIPDSLRGGERVEYIRLRNWNVEVATLCGYCLDLRTATTNKSNAAAFWRGFDAAKDGLGQSSNPYKDTTTMKGRGEARTPRGTWSRAYRNLWERGHNAYGMAVGAARRREKREAQTRSSVIE